MSVCFAFTAFLCMYNFQNLYQQTRKKTKEKLKHVIKNTFYFIFKRFYDIQCIFVFIFFYPRLSKSYHLGGQQRKILVLPKINLAPIYDGVYLEDRVHYYQMSVHR